jgi:hypothetical protein
MSSLAWHGRTHSLAQGHHRGVRSGGLLAPQSNLVRNGATRANVRGGAANDTLGEVAGRESGTPTGFNWAEGSHRRGYCPLGEAPSLPTARDRPPQDFVRHSGDNRAGRTVETSGVYGGGPPYLPKS